MSFDSPFFLFLFLPLTLTILFVVPKAYKFSVLLVISFIFYWWVVPMFLAASIMISLWGFFLSYKIFKAADNETTARRWLMLAVITNIGGLMLVKAVSLPFTGISFLIFVILAYLFDVYNQQIQPERSIWKYLFHIFYFPKVVCGPIMRYEQTGPQMDNIHLDLRSGVLRFIIGLAKKVLLANPLGLIADGIFNLSPGAISTPVAWLGAICYTLQIYYDFSGYTDMAIGLGRFFGIKFPENFQYPYLAISITDFWRRWHITLSKWFREYVFLPLEFSRRWSPWKWLQYVNIMIVFGLTGLWHGLNWTFLLWGLLHGICISLETAFKKPYGRLGMPIRRIYTLLILVIGWVLFRSPSVTYAFTFIKTMAGGAGSGQLQSLINLYFSPYNIGLIVVGMIFTLPIISWGERWYQKWLVGWSRRLVKPAAAVILLVIFAYSLLAVADSTYQAFIYQQF